MTLRIAAALVVALAATQTAEAQSRQKLFINPNQDNQQIRILDAVYGQDQRICRALDEVTRACDGKDYCEVIASNDLCGNPYSNVAKQLFVGYDCGDGRRSVTVDEGQVARVYCRGGDGRQAGPAPVDARPVAPDGWRRNLLYIQGAEYGSSERVCDATPSFNYACQEQYECTVRIDNNLCGDPARGTRKSVEVRYWCNGRLRTESGDEGSNLRIFCQ
ncbi:MAG: hypothetical protein QNJ40_19840 [Xanthomonadales bacterium]|nr:hypothetical protein [Xanthomonadales bacterium]